MKLKREELVAIRCIAAREISMAAKRNKVRDV